MPSPAESQRLGRHARSRKRSSRREPASHGTTDPSSTRILFRFDSRARRPLRASSFTHLHADPGRPRPQCRRLSLDAGRPAAVRLHLRRARRQPGAQSLRLDERFADYMGWSDAQWDKSCRRSPSCVRLLRCPADDGVQRGHGRRSRSQSAPDRAVAESPRRPAAGAGDVGRLRFRGHPEGAAGPPCATNLRAT